MQEAFCILLMGTGSCGAFFCLMYAPQGLPAVYLSVLPRLKAQLADVKGIFKGKERKALEQEIQKLEKTIREELDKLPTILEEDGYPDVQAFTATYRKAEKIVSQYNRDLAQWEQTVQKKKQPAEKPPEKQSVREQLRKLQEEGRKKPRNRSRDYER